MNQWLDKYVKQDDNGYWNPANHGKPVKINSNKITMQGVDQPLLGVSDTGHQQVMHPGQDYIFDGSSVIEYPLMKRGGVTWLNEYQNGGLSIINKAAEKLTDQANYIKKIQDIKNRIANAETYHKDNPYTAVNDTTGAIGKYQFIPLYNPSIVDNYPDLSEFKNIMNINDYLLKLRDSNRCLKAAHRCSLDNARMVKTGPSPTQ